MNSASWKERFQMLLAQLPYIWPDAGIAAWGLYLLLCHLSGGCYGEN